MLRIFLRKLRASSPSETLKSDVNIFSYFITYTFLYFYVFLAREKNFESVEESEKVEIWTSP